MADRIDKPPHAPRTGADDYCYIKLPAALPQHTVIP